MFPCASVFTTTTLIPAITAEAGLVPCADCGIRQMVRCPCPRARWYARITRSPAYSPCEPAFGCSETAAKPVTSASARSRRPNIEVKPFACVRGAKGWSPPTSRQVTGYISALALSFIVQLPSGIIECVSERSRDSRVRM